MRASLAVTLVALALAMPYAPEASAQASSHQRLGTRSLDALELFLGLDLDLAPAVDEWGNSIEVGAAANLGIVIGREISIGLEAPLALRLPRSDDQPSRPTAAMGDPRLALGLTRRLGDWLVSAELAWRQGPGIWEHYRALAARIRSGTGFPTLEAALSASRILDPVLLGLRLGSALRFDRRERYGDAPGPVDTSLELFATEALNESAAFSVGLGQTLRWPRRDAALRAPDWSTSGRATIALAAGASTMRFSVSRTLSEGGSPAAFGLGISRSIKLGRYSR